MSTCISREGEYSDHTPDKDYYCTRCYVLDEPALLDRVRELEGGRGSEWARNAEKRARDSARSWVKASKRIDKLVAERDAATEELLRIARRDASRFEDEAVDAIAERDAALAAIERVRAIHRPVEIEPSSTICGECSFKLPNGKFFGKVEEWPCPTLAALDGAPEPEVKQ